MCEMGLGKGGKIKQKIYENPHGLNIWKENPIKTVKVYLVNAADLPKSQDTKYHCQQKLKITTDYGMI